MSPHQTPLVVSPAALFRFRVVSEVQTRVARGEVRADAIRQTVAHMHLGPDHTSRRIGLRSVYRWLAAYREHGLARLENRPRTTMTDGVLDPALVLFLIDQKTEDPRASVPQLLLRAVTAGLLSDVREVNRVTAWRALKRRHIDTRRRPKVRDQRRFAYPNRLQMVLCDGKHFRAGKARAKRVALFFIDDATRYIPTVVVGTSETAELFLRGLHQLLLSAGRVDGMYVDLGSGFDNHDVHSVLAKLDIAHVLGTAGYPEGRGKIERFNLTAQEALLRHLSADDVDPNCTALELRIAYYLRHEYNVGPHEALKGGLTPQRRFESDERPLTPYEDRDALRQHFFVEVERRVTNDHVISIDSRHWEVPRGLARQRVVVRQDVFDPLHLRLTHEGRSIRLSEVDLAANARDHRARPDPHVPDTPTTSKGAALTAAERDMAAITQSDGGFADIPDED